MKMVRRQFLKLGIFSSIVAGMPEKGKAGAQSKDRFWSIGSEENFHELSILQGATDQNKTQFSVLHPRDEVLSFYSTDEEGEIILPDLIETYSHSDHPMILSKVYFSGLQENRDYSLLLEDTDGNLVAERFYRTLTMNQRNLRFAIASCMDDENHDPDIWIDMVEKDPDVIFFVGDSVYADRLRGSEERRSADPDQLWLRFCQARQTLEIFQSKKLIPIIAVWDDHDFGRNDTGKTYPYVEESQKNFLSFFAQEESHCSVLARGPGVGSAFQYGNQLFLLLDGRSFRETGHSPKRYAHWGEEQEKWALDLIDQHQGFVWIMTGTQIFPSMIFKESVSKHHANNLNGFIDELRNRGTRAGFVSGDVHFSEISEIEDDFLGYRTYEFTSSSIHSTTFPGVPGIIPNKRRIVSTGKRNYLLLNSEYDGSTMNIQVVSHSEQNRTNFERELKI